VVPQRSSSAQLVGAGDDIPLRKKTLSEHKGSKCKVSTGLLFQLSPGIYRQIIFPDADCFGHVSRVFTRPFQRDMCVLAVPAETNQNLRFMVNGRISCNPDPHFNIEETFKFWGEPAKSLVRGPLNNNRRTF